MTGSFVHSAGVSLIELMLAIFLGALVMISLDRLYLLSKEHYSANNRRDTFLEKRIFLQQAVYRLLKQTSLIRAYCYQGNDAIQFKSKESPSVKLYIHHQGLFEKLSDSRAVELVSDIKTMKIKYWLSQPGLHAVSQKNLSDSRQVRGVKFLFPAYRLQFDVAMNHE